MQKIPTIFLRDNEHRYVKAEVNPACAWVFNEVAMATRKYDGICVMFDGTQWFARRQVRATRRTLSKYQREQLYDFPEGFIKIGFDEFTGKYVGWIPMENSGFARFIVEALSKQPLDCDYLNLRDGVYLPGTYELIGPKINNNPEYIKEHRLIPHINAAQLGDIAVLDIHTMSVDVAYEALKSTLSRQLVEGVVFYGLTNNSPDGRMAKLKVRDFNYG